MLPTTEGPAGFFWTSGADGRLRFLACDACSTLIHPPAPVCPRCFGRSATPRPVSGRATVRSFTVNHQAWDGDPEPYVIAVVDLDEQHDVRLTTNLVDVAPHDVRNGMPVEVVFEDHDPVFLPLFRPVEP